jgi:hypothetical protein
VFQTQSVQHVVSDMRHRTINLDGTLKPPTDFSASDSLLSTPRDTAAAQVSK